MSVLLRAVATRMIVVGAVAVLAVGSADADDVSPSGGAELKLSAVGDDADVAVEVKRLLTKLQRQQAHDEAGTDPWAQTLKDLIELGPLAVPLLVTALVETPMEHRSMLRSIPFVLRGIGDARAVPALIQTLPKCNHHDGSDYGFRSKDPKLLAFMQKHDKDPSNDGDKRYFWGRPINEVRTALNALTGTEQGEIELVFVRGHDGTPRHRHLAEQAYHRVAKRWVLWWEDHWREFTDDETYASVELPEPMTVESAVFTFDRDVPLAGDHWNIGNLCEPYQTGGLRVFRDLDIGRFGGLHPRWKNPQDRTNVALIRKWAIAEGFDLMGRELTVDGRQFYVMELLAGEAWRVPASVAEQESFANAAEIIEQGDPVEDILMAGEDDYQNMDAYFIITRHGTPLILRQSGEVHNKKKSMTNENGKPGPRPMAYEHARGFNVRLLTSRQ